MFIIAIFSIIPVVIWAFMEPLGFRFSDLGAITTSIGQVSGLVGMVLFSISLILAARFKVADRYMNGLDKVYQKHHKIGAIAFSLLLFHPLFLVVRYLSLSIHDAAMFFVPFVNPPITGGILSLALMIILIVFTFYVKMKYHRWKLSHKFMTLAYLFGLGHTLMIQSDISRSTLLREYVLFFAVLGLLSIGIKIFQDKMKLKRHKYTVRSVNKLSDDIVEIEMEPKDERMKYFSGQFSFFSFISENVPSEYHPFTIASPNKDNYLKIIAKDFGDYTNKLSSLKRKDDVLIDGPYGRFSFRKAKYKNQIWIAGGIGITPFLAMSQVLKDDYRVNLYYSVKENKDAVRTGLLHDVEKLNPNFRMNLWVTADRGYIKAKNILDLENGLASKDVFLCGPPAFMENMKDQFLSLGVDIKRIHYENFSL